MAEDLIRYDIVIQDALRGAVRKILSEVGRVGLPGEHHFYIAFDTNAPGVRISSRLHERYPKEMTIVLQHQFWGLKVTEDRFEVLLSFNDVHEKLSIPFTAITGFVDPSVKFGLQFQVAEEAQAQETPEGVAAFTPAEKPAAAPEATAEEPAEESAASENGANVVTLDKFRKK